jgi:signal peptidase I
VKRIRARSALLTAVFVTVLAASWWYLAPTRVGGSTTYVVTHGISMEPRFHSGDLALVRPAGQYKVGEVVAYHSSLLHLVVLHRIVAIRNGRYTFKGDNNNFLDPVHPRRSELIGRLWVHVRGGGSILARIHNPIVVAVGCGLLGLFLLWGGDQKRRRRRRQRTGSGASRVARTIMKLQRQIGEARPSNFRVLLISSAVAAVVLLTLAVVAFTRPADKPTSLNTPYTQRVSFGYTAHVRPGPVYPTGTIKTGDPLFLSMVRHLNLHIDYGLTTPAPAKITGTEKVVLTLFGPGGWSRDYVLTPQTRFTAAHTTTDLALDLPQLQGQLAQIARLTGSSSFGTFSAAVVPQIQIAGTIAGHRVNSTFQPALNLQFNSGQLVVSASTSSSGPGGTASSAGSSQTNYAPSQSASVSTPATAPATITVLGVSPTIALLRWIAVIGLLLSIAATAYFYLRKRSEPFVESVRIQSQYGHMIVPIVGGEDLGWPPVDVPDIKALVKLAEAGQRLILHNRSDNVDTYMLNEEGTVYRYQVKPSKVVWGEWSAPTADLEEAASTIARVAAEATTSASHATSPVALSEVSD